MLKLRHFQLRKTSENIIVIREFNVGSAEFSMKHFCDIKSTKHLIKFPTCLKNAGKPKCIDLILTLGKFIPQEGLMYFQFTSCVPCFWEQPFRLLSLGCNWIQNGISKYICSNETLFLPKDVQKTIMKSSRSTYFIQKHRTDTKKRN